MKPPHFTEGYRQYPKSDWETACLTGRAAGLRD